MVKNGRLELRQWKPFGAIYVRKRGAAAASAPAGDGGDTDDFQKEE